MVYSKFFESTGLCISEGHYKRMYCKVEAVRWKHILNRKKFRKQRVLWLDLTISKRRYISLFPLAIHSMMWVMRHKRQILREDTGIFNNDTQEITEIFWCLNSDSLQTKPKNLSCLHLEEILYKAIPEVLAV